MQKWRAEKDKRNSRVRARVDGIGERAESATRTAGRQMTEQPRARSRGDSSHTSSPSAVIRLISVAAVCFLCLLTFPASPCSALGGSLMISLNVFPSCFLSSALLKFSWYSSLPAAFDFLADEPLASEESSARFEPALGEAGAAALGEAGATFGEADPALGEAGAALGEAGAALGEEGALGDADMAKRREKEGADERRAATDRPSSSRDGNESMRIE